MAGEWLKFECSLPEKPETLAITIAMGWDDPDLTVGKLMRLFRWFDQQTIDGNAPSVSAALLDRIIGVSGFVQAVADVGWIVIEGRSIHLANFDRHNGATAKSRALTAKRVANHKSNATANAEGNAHTVSEALPRKEKKREEKKEEKKAPRVPRSSTPHLEGVSDELLSDYIQVRKAKKAGPLTDTAIAGLQREADKAGITLAAAVTACVEFGWQGFNAGWYAERQAKARPGQQAATSAADPDSRQAIEAEGVARGLGPWNEINEQWHVYKARVRGQQRAASLDINTLAAMAAQRQGVH